MTATPTDDTLDLDKFRFRGLHPDIYLGTASDRYAGWLGQIYTPERYSGRITRRTNTVGGKAFVEEVLPVESVARAIGLPPESLCQACITGEYPTPCGQHLADVARENQDEPLRTYERIGR